MQGEEQGSKKPPLAIGLGVQHLEKIGRGVSNLDPSHTEVLWHFAQAHCR